MTTEISGTEEPGSEDCEKQDKMSEGQEMADVFEVFRPSLWTLKVLGVWLPGDLKTIPSTKESLRGGRRAVLYFLYCLLVWASVWVQSLRFIPYAVKQSGGELIVVMVVFISFFTPAYIFLACLSFRKSLVGLVTELTSYFQRYGQRPYVKDMINTGKRSYIVTVVIILILLIPHFLYCYEWSAAFHWITTPVDKGAPWYILAPWKLFIASTWIVIAFSEVAHMNFVALVSTILRNEFFEINRIVRTSVEILNNNDGCRETAIDHPFSRGRRVAQAPKKSDRKGLCDSEEEGKFYTDVVTEEIDDLRCRFEHLVGLVEKGSEVVKYQLADVYLVCIPLLCLIIKGFIEVHGTRDYIIYMSLCFLAVSVGVIHNSVVAVRLNLEAHASSQHLLKISVKHLSEKTIQIINLFMCRLNGPPIGFSLQGLVTIDVSFILALLGTLIAYIFVVVQFNLQSSGTAASASDVFSTACPLNSSVGTT